MSTFVGFGFGPIQAGLFLAEAHLSGNFDRLVVAEVVPEVVGAVRQAGGFTVNIGHDDRIEALVVAPAEIYSPLLADQRAALVDAVAGAQEIATALPSVNFYTTGGVTSPAAILAAGLVQKAQTNGPLAIVYTAENHTHAAALLTDAVLSMTPPDLRAAVCARVQFLDTIIGKMSGAPEETADLAALAPGLDRAYLVEAFNRILIDQIIRAGQTAQGYPLDAGWAIYRRGIEVFVEKADLTPFAEAKLYGHNASHALAAYLAHLLGFTRIDQLCQRPDVLEFIKAALVEESGAALIARHAGVDPLFTPAGFDAYAGDLLRRMVNPFVRDTVARVGRDPLRKLGWDDRLVGAMRRALQIGVEPWRYAWGAAAALDWLEAPMERTAPFLSELWARSTPSDDETDLSTRIALARASMHEWRTQGCPAL